MYKKLFMLIFLVCISIFTMAPTYYNSTGKTYYDPEFSIPPGQNGTTTKYITKTGITLVSASPYWNVNTTTNSPLNISLTAASSTKNVTMASKANPCRISSFAHGYVTNDYVYISGVGGMVEINDGIYQITKISDDHYELNNIDSTTYTTYTSPGTSRKVVPYAVTINSTTKKLSVINCSADMTTRLHYQSIENRPHIADLNEYYDWVDANIQNRVTQILLTEITAGTTPTITVRQEK
jgi:hypothetical protein